MKSTNVGRFLSSLFTRKTTPDDIPIPEDVSWEVLVTALSEVSGVPMSDLEDIPPGRDPLDFIVQHCKSRVHKIKGSVDPDLYSTGLHNAVVYSAQPHVGGHWTLHATLNGRSASRVIVHRSATLDALIQHHKVGRPDSRGRVKLADTFPILTISVDRHFGELFGEIYKFNK